MDKDNAHPANQQGNTMACRPGAHLPKAKVMFWTLTPHSASEPTSKDSSYGSGTPKASNR